MIAQPESRLVGLVRFVCTYCRGVYSIATQSRRCPGCHQPDGLEAI